MAYITKDEVKTIRENLKNYFPKTFKFSVTREHASFVRVALMESPLCFTHKGTNTSTKQLKAFNHKTIFNVINSIVNASNYNNSDSMTDYFDVGFYSEITLGKWDKSYIQSSINN